MIWRVMIATGIRVQEDTGTEIKHSFNIHRSSIIMPGLMKKAVKKWHFKRRGYQKLWLLYYFKKNQKTMLCKNLEAPSSLYYFCFQAAWLSCHFLKWSRPIVLSFLSYSFLKVFQSFSLDKFSCTNNELLAKNLAQWKGGYQETILNEGKQGEKADVLQVTH